MAVVICRTSLALSPWNPNSNFVCRWKCEKGKAYEVIYDGFGLHIISREWIQNECGDIIKRIAGAGRLAIVESERNNESERKFNCRPRKSERKQRQSQQQWPVGIVQRFSHVSGSFVSSSLRQMVMMKHVWSAKTVSIWKAIILRTNFSQTVFCFRGAGRQAHKLVFFYFSLMFARTCAFQIIWCTIHHGA